MWQALDGETTRFRRSLEQIGLRIDSPVADRNAFMAQEPGLAVKAAAIADERAVGADHAVTGYDDGNGVMVVGKTDGACTVLVADPLGNVAIGGGGPAWDAPELGPNSHLEWGALGLGWNIFDRGNIAGEIGAQAIREAEWVGGELNVTIRKAPLNVLIRPSRRIIE